MMNQGIQVKIHFHSKILQFCQEKCNHSPNTLCYLWLITDGYIWPYLHNRFNYYGIGSIHSSSSVGIQVQADECDIVAGYSGFPNTTDILTAHLPYGDMIMSVADMIMSVAAANMCNDSDIFYCLLENQSYKLVPTNLQCHVFVALLMGSIQPQTVYPKRGHNYIC